MYFSTCAQWCSTLLVLWFISLFCLFSLCVLCALCCQFPWIGHSWECLIRLNCLSFWIRPRFLVGSVLLIFLVFCVVLCFFVNVFFCLSMSCVLCALCCQFLWICHSWLALRFSLTFILQYAIYFYPYKITQKTKKMGNTEPTKNRGFINILYSLSLTNYLHWFGGPTKLINLMLNSNCIKT